MIMVEIVIEKDVPISDLPARAKRHKYPFAEMNVGDSFFVKLDAKGINVLRVLAQRYAKKNYCTFATKQTDGGLRIWRIE